MPTPILKTESVLTDRYQTTIPEVVRKALHLGKRDKIHYIVQSDGHVMMTRAEDKDNDPVIAEFLYFLATDCRTNPQHLQAINPDLLHRVQSLISGVSIDLDQLLPEDDESESSVSNHPRIL